ncbi:MAG: DsrE family protein [Anaerolineales bacterium]|nr:DsrE family protein [Anaerolineales bacterium]
MPDTETSIVILINRNGMGEADPALQQKLLQTYLALLIEGPSLPAVIGFYGEGVRLVAADSPVLAPLRSLEAKGVRLVACSTCLNYYNLLDQVQVGIAGGMPDIIEAQWRAGKVITL